MKDLHPDENKCLSVWYIEEDHSNLPRIVAALAAGRDHLAVFDYALVNQNVLSELQIAMLLSEGSSLDEYANK